jgi:ClpP class serine protease
MARAAGFMFRQIRDTIFGRSAERSAPERPAFSGPGFAPREPQIFGTEGGGASDEIVRTFQSSRNSHVIGLIHRHQHARESWEQWFFDAMIGEHHLQDFMAAIAQVPPGAKLDIILHAIGGFSLPVQQIARAIKAHPGETTIFVPHHAHFLATLIALAGDRLVMGPAATLSYLEPSDELLQKVVRQKGVNRTQDLTIMRLSMARNHGRELRSFVKEIMAGTAPARAVGELVGGKRAPWDPLTARDAKAMGLNVSTDMPPELYRLLQACRSAPVRDQGVHIVERQMSAARARALLPNDLETCLAHGALAPLADGLGLSGPQVLAQAEDGADDDPHGVALESCDLTLRPLIAAMEQARGSRVVCIIHQPGMESSSVDTVTAEDVLTALQSTPANKPLDIILHTPGGYSYQAHQIALAVKAHRGPKTVFVPFFAMSGGTIISLAADQIVMAPHAVLGPIDSQFPVQHLRRMMPARAILDLCATKRGSRIHDELVELGIECARAVPQDHKAAVDLMRGTYNAGTAERIAHTLNDGSLTHGYPVTLSFARKLGLNVHGDIPPEAIAIVRAYRRNRWGKRSVVFCG